MSRLKQILTPTVIFYLTIFLLFFAVEPVAAFALEWADTHNLGAELVLGLALPVLLLMFCIIGCSTIVTMALKVKTDKYSALLPVGFFIITILIYCLLPESENRVWMKIIVFYLGC